MTQGITLTADDVSHLKSALLLLREDLALTSVSLTSGAQTLTLTRHDDGGFTIAIDAGSPVVHHRFTGKYTYTGHYKNGTCIT